MHVPGRLERALVLPALFVSILALATTASAEKTLYDRLGGKSAISAVVDDFVGRAASDPRIAGFFAATAADPARLAGFKGRLVDQICQAAGGPCTYGGRSMKEAHHGMGVSGAHFEALVEDLTRSLEKAGVAETDRATLLGVLGPMRGDIVER